MSVALLWVIEKLKHGRPRLVGPIRNRRPIFVFVDGACEEDGTTVGGVILKRSGAVECFGTEVPKAVVEGWKTKQTQTQVIGQAEIFPALMARLVWAKELRDERTIFFIDNESARLALVKAYSPVLASLRLIMECLEWDQKSDCFPWYARVPTYSNLADGPSRLTYTAELKSLGAKIVSPLFPVHGPKGRFSSLGKFRTLRYQ